MTKEEKIQKYIDSKNREQKLEDMRDSMWDWDTQTLIDTAFDHIAENMDKLNDKDFDDEYYEWFYHKFEGEEFDGDTEECEIVKLDKCNCDLYGLMNGRGHDDNCPEK